jgi:hypothetical protein
MRFSSFAGAILASVLVLSAQPVLGATATQDPPTPDASTPDTPVQDPPDQESPAQDSPAQAPPAEAPRTSQLEDVVVEGRRAQTRDAVAAFVRDVSQSDGRRAQLARFDRRVCPGVVNLRPDYAQVLNDRIARVALALELRVGDPGCVPNILIVAAANAAEIDALIDAAPNAFEAYARTIEGGTAAIERVREPRPVRWWHQVEFVDTNERWSRLRAAGRTDIRRALILLDMEQIGPVNFGALSDYVAMVALVRLRPDADVSGQPTILNLFEDADSRRSNYGLSQWDANYLESVYGAPRYARQRRQQEADIVWQMMRRPDSAPANAPPPNPEP